jgi:hypothetical protein
MLCWLTNTGRYFDRPEAIFVPFDWRLDWQREDYVRKSGSLARRAAFEARLSILERFRYQTARGD